MCKNNTKYHVGLATIGTIVVTRGRAARKAQLLNSIPAELRAKFEKIQNLEGKEFIHKSYQQFQQLFQQKTQ